MCDKSCVVDKGDDHMTKGSSCVCGCLYVWAALLLQVFLFGDKCILNDPPEQWPFCDALIAFYSSGFPLDKVRKEGLG